MKLTAPFSETVKLPRDYDFVVIRVKKKCIESVRHGHFSPGDDDQDRTALWDNKVVKWEKAAIIRPVLQLLCKDCKRSCE